MKKKKITLSVTQKLLFIFLGYFHVRHTQRERVCIFVHTHIDGHRLHIGDEKKSLAQ